MEKFKLSLFISFSALIAISCFSAQLFANNDPKENGVGAYECELVKKVIYEMGDVDQEVFCHEGYHHYNANGWKKFYKDTNENIKIASFNIFKLAEKHERNKRVDYIASIINNWDLVVGLEMLPLSRVDNDHNLKIAQFIKDSKDEISDLNNNQIPELKNKLKDMKEELKELEENDGSSSKINQLKKEISKLDNELDSSKDRARLLEDQVQEAKNLYRVPGFIDVLRTLQKKHGKDWALILSGDSQGSSSTVQEYVGFFYRSSKVKPLNHAHCKKVLGLSVAPACIPKFSENLDRVFSRRPMISSFKSGNFDFTLVGSHIRFLAPDEETLNVIRDLVLPVDSVQMENVQLLGRFAELRLTLLLMDKLRAIYNENDLIFLGDLNLEQEDGSSFGVWEFILNTFKGVNLFGNFKTTVSRVNGLGSKYDHIMLDPSYTSECLTGSDIDVKRFNFLDENEFPQIVKDFSITNLSPDKREKLITNRLKDYRDELENYKTIKYKKIEYIYNKEQIDDILDKYTDAVFKSQFDDSNKYAMYIELISDHLPVYMSCRTDKRDDD